MINLNFLFLQCLPQGKQMPPREKGVIWSNICEGINKQVPSSTGAPKTLLIAGSVYLVPKQKHKSSARKKRTPKTGKITPLLISESVAPLLSVCGGEVLTVGGEGESLFICLFFPARSVLLLLPLQESNFSTRVRAEIPPGLPIDNWKSWTIISLVLRSGLFRLTLKGTMVRYKALRSGRSETKKEEGKLSGVP